MSQANTRSEAEQKTTENGTQKIIGKPKPDEFWNFELVSLQVEQTVFRVPIHGLAIPGSAFEAMLSLPKPADHEEGPSNEKPILLEGIQESDFRSFLRGVYGNCSDSGSRHVMGFDDWVAFLKLSTMWGYDEMRNQAIEELSKLIDTKTLQEKLYLGRKYTVTTWTLDALVKLVQKNPVTLEELTTSDSTFALDWKTIAKIFYIREEIYRPPVQTCTRCHSTFREDRGHSCGPDSFYHDSYGRASRYNIPANTIWDSNPPIEKIQDLVEKYFSEDIPK